MVRKGQALMYLKTDLLVPKRDKARAEFENAKRSFERLQEAYKNGVCSDTDLDNAEMKYQTKKALYNEIQAMLDRWVIRAPIDGILNKLPVEVGEYVTPGQVVAEIVDVDCMKFVFKISEFDIGFMRLGAVQTLRRVSASGEEEEVIKGKISYIDRVADKQTKTTRVEILVPNEPNKNGIRKFRAGSTIKAIMQRREIKNAIMIPINAVIAMSSPTGETYHVCYIVKDGKAERKTVKLGIFKGHMVQIKSGLKAGDELIVLGAKSGVGPGQEVAIRNADGTIPGTKKAGKKSDAKKATPSKSAKSEVAKTQNVFHFSVTADLEGTVPVETESYLTKKLKAS